MSSGMAATPKECWREMVRTSSLRSLMTSTSTSTSKCCDGAWFLDTNRSSVVEALGTDLVSFTQLTCPLPTAFRLEGPAWLPNDRAAYFIVRSPDPIDAPDYPVGLYRISSDARSSELVLEDPAFEDLEFIDHFGNSNSQPLHAVAADGQRALVKGRSVGDSNSRLGDGRANTARP